MREARIAFVLSALVAAAGAETLVKPEGIRVSTWVREDIFAGFLVKDMARFEQGEKKIEVILKETPGDVVALAWRGGAELSRAVWAHEKGDAAEFARLYDKALKTLDGVYAAEPTNEAVLAIYGGVYAIFADRLPAERRRDGWEKLRTRYEQLADRQKAFFDKLPVHMRGEVLAGLAQAEFRLGNDEKGREILNRIANTLGGTPYEPRAKKWLAEPATIAKSSIACLTCHDEGRLEAVLAKKKAPAD